jgi:hypothetical protein
MDRAADASSRSASRASSEYAFGPQIGWRSTSRQEWNSELPAYVTSVLNVLSFDEEPLVQKSAASSRSEIEVPMQQLQEREGFA